MKTLLIALSLFAVTATAETSLINAQIVDAKKDGGFPVTKLNLVALIPCTAAKSKALVKRLTVTRFKVSVVYKNKPLPPNSVTCKSVHRAPFLVNIPNEMPAEIELVNAAPGVKVELGL